MVLCSGSLCEGCVHIVLGCVASRYFFRYTTCVIQACATCMLYLRCEGCTVRGINAVDPAPSTGQTYGDT